MKGAIVLAAAGLVAAQLPDISNVPQCAITCLLPALTSTGCSLTDLSCACKAENQEKIRSQATPCLEKGCSKDDLQKALDAANSLCGGGVSSISSGSASATSTGASSASSSASSASSSAATTGTASSSIIGVLPPVSSGHSTALPGNGTSTSATSATHTTSHGGSGGSSSTSAAGTSATTTAPGSNDAAGPVAGVLAAIAAAVFAL